MLVMSLRVLAAVRTISSAHNVRLARSRQTLGALLADRAFLPATLDSFSLASALRSPLPDALLAQVHVQLVVS
jgi:uncharacterized membrane protein